ncbi:hypothetical protein Ddye_005392 [Dipteronia dyeriana]|uniref:Protein FAM33A n=1 Tax=Dipteronia dyeriana TaxID=168575 RepID=A0AAD9XG87_9ROSI|nr:hypothetical protein Ddye_005392 [Dipteronia dyeriana]
MGNHNYPQNHQAIDGLMSLLTKSNHELATIQYKLEKEFQKIYPENANPMKLVSRVKKLQEDLSTLKDQCQELLSGKQDLIDKAQTTLVGNRTLVQRMQASLGVPGESEDPAFDSFKQVIDEWTIQVRSRTGDEKHESDSEDINKLLFSAIVESN